MTAGAGRFVGRASELERLFDDLALARAGHGALVLLSGEPGIGKTRLAEELCTRANDGAVRVHWGRCWNGGAPPFWPWRQALRDASATAEQGSTDEISAVAPLL